LQIKNYTVHWGGEKEIKYETKTRRHIGNMKSHPSKIQGTNTNKGKTTEKQPPYKHHLTSEIS
jgi:hypothetical protein